MGIEDFNTTPASNTAINGISVAEGMLPSDVNNAIRQLMAYVKQDLFNARTDVASAATTDLGAAGSNYIHVTGTTTITSLGTETAGVWKFVLFEGALTLTHDATSLILPGGANITTAAGDFLLAESEGSGNWRVVTYQRADTPPFITGSWTPVLTFNTPGNVAVTYAVQVGRYMRCGSQVVARGSITTSAFTHTTASGSLIVTGLPYTSANVTNMQAVGALSWAGITKANYTDVEVRLGPNSATLDFLGSGSGQARSNIAAADMPTGGTVTLDFTIIYEAA